MKSLEIELSDIVGEMQEFPCQIVLEKSLVPKELGLGEDLRELGCVFHSISFE